MGAKSVSGRKLLGDLAGKIGSYSLLLVDVGQLGLDMFPALRWGGASHFPHGHYELPLVQ